MSTGTIAGRRVRCAISCSPPYRPCGSELAREGVVSVTSILAELTPSRASSLPQVIGLALGHSQEILQKLPTLTSQPPAV
ncbi:hypothetical protein F7R20_21165 [Pseudomonas brassicacearum subsp. brassicacearum]|nr:hypothetical protein F7R20_21165 [Pseudomonas brassicacearum subsp. brassicacearum]QEO79939.1 hypothetical protein ELZ14_21205 [Pseudomonas brassicacearum]